MRFRAIFFDAFGTIAEIAEKRNPYGILFDALGCKSEMAKRLAMTIEADIVETLFELGTNLQPENQHYQDFQKNLATEINSVRLLPHINEILSTLREIGYQLWVVSNLAQPYGQPLMDAVGDRVDGFTLSYLCGNVKPEPEIFLKACSELDLSPQEVLMIGDHPRNDVAGARELGAGAALVPAGGITMDWINDVLSCAR